MALICGLPNLWCSLCSWHTRRALATFTPARDPYGLKALGPRQEKNSQGSKVLIKSNQSQEQQSGPEAERQQDVVTQITTYLSDIKVIVITTDLSDSFRM